MSPIDFWAAVLSGALLLSVPIILAGVGEIFLEKTGGFNVGIEGFMLVAAASSVIAASVGGFWVGLLGGILAGTVFGLVLGAATAYGKADIVVVGVALGLVGVGLSIFLAQLVSPTGSTKLTVETQPRLESDVVAGIPLIGRAIDDAGVLFGIAIVLSLLGWAVLTHTRFGLRLRTVGDSEALAVLRGISPTRYRMVAAALAGAFAGLAGAAVPLASIGTFSAGMTGGAGFIALAVVIIARGHVLWLVVGALMFAGFNSLALLSQTAQLGVPVELLHAFPYVATLVVLCVAAARFRRRTALTV